MIRRAGLSATLLMLLVGLASCAAPSREPKNLSLLKQEIITYVDSGQYLREVAVVAHEATAWIEQRAARGGGRLAVVFDIDETVLSNLSHMREMDFGYQADVWSAWIVRAEGAPIEPVCATYRAARARGVEIIFITGRRERDRPGTEKNLQATGLGGYTKLFFKPAEEQGTTQQFKTETRRRLEAEGCTIIANIGDQQSDLDGGYAERTFKLPAPFYQTK